MINWNDIKNFDITEVDLRNLDLTNIDLTRFDVRNLDLPSFEMPKFEMPDFDMPDVEMPKFDLPKRPEIDLPVDQVVGFARDAAYASVGAVVITAQKATERRRELTDQVSSQVRKLVDSVA